MQAISVSRNLSVGPFQTLLGQVLTELGSHALRHLEFRSCRRLARRGNLAYTPIDAPMNWLDVALLVLIGIGAISGFKFGMVQAAASLVAVAVGIALASRIGNKLQPLFALLTDNENTQQVAGFILVLVIAVLLGMVASGLVVEGLTAIKLGWANTVGGLVVGALIVMIACSAALANVQEVSILDPDETIEDSAVGTFLADNFDVVLRGIRLVPKDFGHY